MAEENKIEAVKHRLDELMSSKDYAEAVKYYDDVWAAHYNADQVACGRDTPKQFAQIVASHLKDKSSKILDIGAGTGIVGQLLAAEGYSNMEAHDGSVKMLELAKKTGVYKEYYCEIMYSNQSSKVMPKHAFDAVLACGVFCDKHMDETHLVPVLELLKPGGLALIGIGKDSWADGGAIRAEMDKLQAKNVCKLVAVEDFPTTYQDKMDEEANHEAHVLCIKVL